jgi:8-oxo-dGTP pyrophosphatase MutT (NUDIX family)
VRNPKGEILLIERARPPWGWAPIAGHVDEEVSKMGEPLWEAAARREVQEEVGITLKGMRRVREGRKENKCRREGGDWHDWVIFEAESTELVSVKEDEVKGYKWASKEEIQKLAERTEEWLDGEITDQDWRENPGLELVWKGWLEDLGITRGQVNAPEC